MRSLRNASLAGKTVLVRVDFNVPLGPGRKVADDFRIRMALPTIHYLLKKGATVVLVSHLGRPKGREAGLSLQPVAKHLARLLKRKIYFSSPHPRELALMARFLPPQSVVMLENIRFWSGEEKNDASFARILSRLGDLFVNDAFSVSHRKAASLVAITRYLPSYAGFLLEREIANLKQVTRAKRKPFGVIIGGGKVEDKFPLVEVFLKKAEWVFVGGGVANTFLWADGFRVGKSLKGRAFYRKAKRLLRNEKLLLPDDWITGRNYTTKSARYYHLKDIARNELILDIGKKSAAKVRKLILKSRMILWSGPVGYFENPKFAQGSRAIARLVAHARAFSVVGGGDTVDLIRSLGLEKRYSFVSTGGGAMIDYLAGKKLPGIEALQ